METKRFVWAIGVRGRFNSKIENSFFKEAVMSTKHFSCLSAVSYAFFMLTALFMYMSPPAVAYETTMTFEEFLGQDDAEIGRFYPGVHFVEITSGEDWIVSDVTTGNYNASSWPSGEAWGTGNYWMYDYVSAWTSVVGEGGKIIFDAPNVTFVEIGYSCSSQLNLYAYDINENQIDSDSQPGNLRYENNNETGPGTLRVDAPSGNFIKYIIIHDTGNYWLVDNIIVGTTMEFTKDDGLTDSECASKDQSITYEICLDNADGATIEDAFIIDRLPPEVDYPAGFDRYVYDGNSLQFVEGDPNYNAEEHYYLWELGDIAPDESFCLELEVIVNGNAQPGVDIYNVAELWATVYDVNGVNPESRIIAIAEEYTNICCFGDDPNLIYVDLTATGDNSGTSWTDAYTDLADALERAAKSECGGPFTVYVAQGTYDPNNTPPEKTFQLPDNCSVYGGFKTGGCPFEDRDPKKYKTILTGDFDNDGFPDADSVVTMGDETLLDGFTVTDASAEGYGIFGNGVDFAIENCTVENNNQYGIYAENGNVTVKWCKVLLNDRHGIYHSGAGYTLTVENSWLLRNAECGILSETSTPTVKNSIVSESDFIDDEFASAGIRIVNPTGQPKLHNLTISNNKAEGIYFEHTDPNYFKEENSANRIEIQNCIVYFNNDNGPQLSPQLDLNLDRVAHYSCIADCNSVNNNTSAVPKFAYLIDDPNGMPDPNGVPDPNNYHLHYDDTTCKDRGDPYGVYTGQVDMDGEGVDRIIGTQIDIGADEVRACATSSNDDIYNALDWDADGLVNLKEFSKFQKAWLSRDSEFWDPNLVDPNDFINWNSMCDLNNDHQVTLPDIIQFIDETPWLWKACWKDSGLYEATAMSGGGESMMMAAPMTMTEFTSISEPLPTPEPTIEEQIFALEDCIELLEKIWLEDPYIQEEIDPADWKRFMDAVYQGLLELQDLKAESVQIE